MGLCGNLASKVIIPQQQFQHSHFEINKHQYSSVNINIKVFDSGLNKGLHFFIINHLIVTLIMIFDGYLEDYVLHSKKGTKQIAVVSQFF